MFATGPAMITHTMSLAELVQEHLDENSWSTIGDVEVYLALDDKQEALRWLEQSYQDRAGADIGWIRVDSLLDPLHGDPGFEALAEKIVPAAQFGKKATTKQ